MNRQRGFAAIGLSNPKTPSNVGSVLRAAHCFGASMVATTGRRYTKSATDVTKGFRHIPLLNVDDLRAVIPHGAVPVAVDLVDRARPMASYQHPESAFYVFGPEDGTLGAGVLDWCRDVIYIPTAFCLNLAGAVNVVLYDRQSKAGGAQGLYQKRSRP